MLKDVCCINVSVARNNLDVLQRRETTVMDTQHGCRPPCCLVFAEALNCERINRKALGLIQPPPQIIEVLINCEWVATLISVGLKVSYPMVRMVVRGRIDPHRPAALHLICLVSFLSLAFLFSLFCLPSSTLTSPHLSSPLFLLSRPARAPHINRLWLIRCKCEMHKKKRALAKIRCLVCKQLSTTVQGRTGRTGRSRWCNMRLHKSPGDPRQIQRNEHKPRAALHTVTQDKLR